MQTNQKQTPAIEKILEAVPTPKAAALDWANGEIECQTVKLDKPYGHQQDESIAVGMHVSNRHGVTGVIEQIVWMARSGCYRAKVRCLGNPNLKISDGEFKYLIVTNGTATTR